MGVGKMGVGKMAPNRCEDMGTRLNQSIMCRNNQVVSWCQLTLLFCRNETELEDFCTDTCPDNVQELDQSNCCVWHANIHTCHPSITVSVQEHNMCTPFVVWFEVCCTKYLL